MRVEITGSYLAGSGSIMKTLGAATGEEKGDLRRLVVEHT